jgi:hypothetical protein
MALWQRHPCGLPHDARPNKRRQAPDESRRASSTYAQSVYLGSGGTDPRSCAATGRPRARNSSPTLWLDGARRSLALSAGPMPVALLGGPWSAQKLGTVRARRERGFRRGAIASTRKAATNVFSGRAADARPGDNRAAPRTGQCICVAGRKPIFSLASKWQPALGGTPPRNTGSRSSKRLRHQQPVRRRNSLSLSPPRRNGLGASHRESRSAKNLARSNISSATPYAAMTRLTRRRPRAKQRMAVPFRDEHPVRRLLFTVPGPPSGGGGVPIKILVKAIRDGSGRAPPSRTIGGIHVRENLSRSLRGLSIGST